MTDIARRKCPACGTLGPQQLTPTTLKCACCGVADTIDRFKAVGEDTETHPNLAAVGMVGMIVGPDIDFATVKRIALLSFDCRLVPNPSSESMERAAKAVYMAAMAGVDRKRPTPWEDLSDETRQVGRAAVAAVMSELGYGL